MCRCHRPLAIFWACGTVKAPAGQPRKRYGREVAQEDQDRVLVGGTDGDSGPPRIPIDVSGKVIPQFQLHISDEQS